MTRLLPILLFSLFFSGTKAQSTAPESADLNSSKKISVNTKYIFSSSPKGFGTLQEFPRNPRRSQHYFEQERNTIWLTIEIPYSGTLTFEISPHSVADDYDWMLFDHAAYLHKRMIKDDARLLRSNNSRNDSKLFGATGLKNGSPQLFEVPGPGESYSRPFSVKTGQKLLLIIDNIYGPGKGFDFISTLMPRVLQTRVLSGTVTDKITGQPLSAKIICEDDSTGVQMAETLSAKDGRYSLEIPAERSLNITATNPEYLFQTIDVFEDDRGEQHFKLSKITAIEKLQLFNIHFTPDKDLISANSEPELERLADFLKAQKDLIIRITGHTNNNPFADARYLQRLSFNRAIAVKQYLVKKGVAEDRMSCTGMGGRKPIARNASDGWRNLRVEVSLYRK